MLAVELGHAAHLGAEEGLEVGLRLLVGDDHGKEHEGQPGLDLFLHGVTQPLPLAPHLHHCIQETNALYEEGVKIITRDSFFFFFLKQRVKQL